MAIKEPKVFRLRDILTSEVSIVDRAANQRKFLLRKSEGGQPIESDGAGNFVTQGAQPGEPPPADPKPEPSDPKPAEPTDPKPEPKPDDGKPVEVTEKTYASLVKAVESLTALTKSVKPVASLKLDAASITDRVAEALSNVEFTTERTVPAYWEDGWKCSAAALQKALKTASAKLVEVADSLAVTTGDSPPPHELRWRIVDVLDNLVEYTRFEVAQRAMEKRAEPEATQFAQLVKGLSALLGQELEERVDQQHAMELVSAAEDVVKAQRARIHTLQKRVHALESEPQLTRRIPVETQHHEVRKTNEVRWPRDMNETPLDDDLSFT